jgi:hypothetical protein
MIAPFELTYLLGVHYTIKNGKGEYMERPSYFSKNLNEAMLPDYIGILELLCEQMIRKDPSLHIVTILDYHWN